jgi:folylpolyglutamate synthase/dihydropteroate synthase
MSKDKIWVVELFERKELPEGTPFTRYNVRADSVQEAIEKAEIAAKDDGLTLIAGSCHFVLEVDI